MLNSNPLFRLTDEENNFCEYFLETWMSGMRTVYSTEPQIEPLIAVLAATDLLDETIRQAFKDLPAARDHYLAIVDTFRRRMYDVKRRCVGAMFPDAAAAWSGA